VKAESELLFELSWEVCNKVGGIYTVVISKAALMKKHFENYFCIGPYFEDNAKLEFEAENPPKEIKECFDEVAKEGIKCYYGKWKIKSEPYAILIDFSGIISKKNEIKTQMWNDYKIDSYRSGWDFEEPMLWSYAAGKLIEKIIMKYPRLKASVQCHEWMSGFALLYLKKAKARIGTVFTTHATMLGRAMAANNYDLYNLLGKINPDEEAFKLNVEGKHTAEKACCHAADAFTTVSEITSIEAEKLLGKKADILVLNGLDIHQFPTIEETSIKHITVREKIREFLAYYFFPYYSFDLSHNLIYFIMARYEFRNKGIDVFIKALGIVNERLKKEDLKRTISAFFWVPGPNTGRRVEVLENKTYYRHIKNFVNYHSEEIINKVILNILSEDKLSIPSIFTEEFLEHLRKDIIHFRRKGSPPLSTHYMDEEKDSMLTELKKNGLLNREEDKLKVIVYPVYLDGADDILDLGYYDAIAGCHLGVFPSYYEPYGYTPLEGAALGVASITTDLAGFGRFIDAQQKGKKKEGIIVLKRMNVSDQEVINNLAEALYNYLKLDHAERVHNKTVAKSLAALADWGVLIENYIQAHNIAVEKVFGKNATEKTEKKE
jgi:glycogen(starch) synthase